MESWVMGWRKRSAATFWVASVVAHAGCAQVHSGPYGVPVGPGNQPTGSRTTQAGLTLSADELTRWSSPQFGMIEVTFENDSGEWVEVRDLHVALPPDQTPGTTILTSQRIAAFREAARQRHAIEQQNVAVALGVLTLGGLVLAETTEGAPKALGAVSATAGLGGLIAMDAKDSADRVSHVEPLPKSHLLGGSISVGPGLFAKRWIVLETNPSVARACVDRLRVSYRVQSGHEERVWLRFRDASSAWQREACRQR